MTLDPADFRRAAALILHFEQEDSEGVHALLQETAEAGRAAPLILAMLQIYSMLMPELKTPLALTWLSDALLKVAAEEGVA